MELGKYDLRDEDAIREYLEIHPDLYSILDEAYSVIEEVFGEGTRVVLELIHDTEIENYEQLFGYIDTEMYTVEEAFQLLQDFDDRWYTDKIDLIGERLNFLI